MPSSPPTFAIAELYSAHNGWLTGWLRRRIGCSAHAADMAQDTFVRLLLAERATRLPSELREPRHFLVTIAKRVMVDHFRRRSLEQAYLDALALQPQAEQISPEERLLILETLLALDAMLDGLGSKAKQAFLLSQLEGLGYSEIAQRLGVSVSSVTKYIAKATERCLLFALDAQL